MVKKVVFCLMFVCSIAFSQYSDNAIRIFMNSCTSSGQSYESCACQIQTLQENVSFSDYLMFDAKVRMGTISQSELSYFRNIVSGCNGRISRDLDEELERSHRNLQLQNDLSDKQLEQFNADCDRRARNYRPPKY